MFVLYSLVERNQPCLWTAVERSSGPNTRRYSKPTSRLSETRTWRMERGSLWRLRTWAAVRSTPRQSPTTPMAGQCVVVGYQIHTSDAVYTHARNPSISFGLDNDKVLLLCYRFVVVCGDGEYIIYTAMALRNKSFGSAQEFVWGSDSSVYATRESTSSVKIFKNFKEQKAFKPEFGAEGKNENMFAWTKTHWVFSISKHLMKLRPKKNFLTLFVIVLMLGHTVWLRAMWIDTCSFGPSVTVHVHMNQHSVSQLSIWTLVMM